MLETIWVLLITNDIAALLQHQLQEGKANPF